MCVTPPASDTPTRVHVRATLPLTRACCASVCACACLFVACVCSCADLKLLTASDALTEDGFIADTPYTIMFGPDKCGETNKVHFILRHQNPVSKEWEEKHLVTPPAPNTVDKQTHLYTAIVGTDNSVKILVDNKEEKTVRACLRVPHACL